MSTFPNFYLDRLIESAIEEVMEGYEHSWHYNVTVTKVGITDHGVDVDLYVHFDIQYNTTPIVEEEPCLNTRTCP